METKMSRGAKRSEPFNIANNQLSSQKAADKNQLTSKQEAVWVKDYNETL